MSSEKCYIVKSSTFCGLCFEYGVKSQKAVINILQKCFAVEGALLQYRVIVSRDCCVVFTLALSRVSRVGDCAYLTWV